MFVEPSPVLNVESIEHSYLEKCSSNICRIPGNIKNLASRNAVILDRCMSNLFILLTSVWKDARTKEKPKMNFLIKEHDIKKKWWKTPNIKKSASRNAVILDRCMSIFFYYWHPSEKMHAQKRSLKMKFLIKERDIIENCKKIWSVVVGTFNIRAKSDKNILISNNS